MYAFNLQALVLKATQIIKSTFFGQKTGPGSNFQVYFNIILILRSICFAYNETITTSLVALIIVYIIIILNNMVNIIMYVVYAHK